MPQRAAAAIRRSASSSVSTRAERRLFAGCALGHMRGVIHGSASSERPQRLRRWTACVTSSQRNSRHQPVPLLHRTDYPSVGGVGRRLRTMAVRTDLFQGSDSACDVGNVAESAPGSTLLIRPRQPYKLILLPINLSHTHPGTLGRNAVLLYQKSQHTSRQLRPNDHERFTCERSRLTVNSRTVRSHHRTSRSALRRSQR